jgi:hypothetical protein
MEAKENGIKQIIKISSKYTINAMEMGRKSLKKE